VITATFSLLFCCLYHAFINDESDWLVTHADGSRCVGRVISGVCRALCVCLSVLKKENGLNYQPQTLYTHDRTTACIDPGVKRSKVKVKRLSNALLAWVYMQVDTTAGVSS